MRRDFLSVQPQGVEQQFTELLRRSQVEINPSSFFGVRFQPLQGCAHFLRKALQIRHIDADAGGFHQGQHRLQRLLNLFKQLASTARTHRLKLTVAAAGPGDGSHARPSRSTWLARLNAGRPRRSASCRQGLRDVGRLKSRTPVSAITLQTMFRRGIAQIVRQQCVHHHALQEPGHAVTESGGRIWRSAEPWGGCCWPARGRGR